jgi:hypothetical protein
MGVEHQGGSNSRGPGGVPANLGLRHPRSSSVAAYRGLVLIRTNQLMRHFLLGPSFLHLGSGFGNLGHLSIANSLFGWL